MKLRAKGYINQLNFSDLRKYGRINPFVVLHNNNERQLSQRQASRELLLQTLKCPAHLFDLLNKKTPFLLFNFIKQNNNLVRAKLERLHERFNNFYKLDISLSTMRRAINYLSALGLITKYQINASSGDQTFSYQIDLPTIRNHVANFDRKYLDLLEKYGVYTRQEKNEQIIIKNEVYKNYTVYKTANNNQVSSAQLFSFNNFQVKKMKSFQDALDTVTSGSHLTPIDQQFKPDLYTWRWCTETKAIPEVRVKFILKKFVERHIKDKDKSDDWSARFKGFMQKCIEKKWYELPAQRTTSKNASKADTAPIASEIEKYKTIQAQSEVEKLLNLAANSCDTPWFNCIKGFVKDVIVKDEKVYVFIPDWQSEMTTTETTSKVKGLAQKLYPHFAIGAIHMKNVCYKNSIMAENRNRD